jgi:DNA-binding beta-propeller fold protein YncE
MNKVFVVAVLLSLFLSAGCSTVFQSSTTEPIISQTVTSFHRPESSTFSMDGKYLFVANCASGLYGKDKNFALKVGDGAISKLAVSESGELKMIDPKFVSGLNTPLGTTTLLKPTKMFPAGSLFVNTGIYVICDKDDKYITDPKVMGTGVTIIDPDSGKILGHIDTTPGSAVVKAIGDNFPLPNGIIFDTEGNLYVTDTGESCGVKNTAMPAKGKGGVIRINHDAIDSFAQNKAHDGIHFIPVTLPNGIAFNPHTDSVLVVTCQSGEGETNDSVYSIPTKDFMKTKEPKALVSGLGSLDGAAVTPAGTVIVSVMKGNLTRIAKDGTKEEIAFDPAVKFMGPSDIKIRELKDGASILLLPEQDHLNPNLWKQRLRVVRLPKGY